MDNMNELNLDEMNNIVGGAGGSPHPLPDKSGCIVYRIARGDTLGKIARRYGFISPYDLPGYPPLIMGGIPVACGARS